MFYQIFLSPQLKLCAINTNKHGTYHLRHELVNELRHRILRKKDILGKCLSFIKREPSAKSPCQIKHTSDTSEKVPNNSN